MNDEEKSNYVKNYLLEDAICSIELNRRYWNPSISRTLSSTLTEALKEEGYSVIAWEIPPQWEHVFYLEEGAGDYNDEIRLIAKRRFELMERGVQSSLLPK